MIISTPTDVNTLGTTILIPCFKHWNFSIGITEGNLYLPIYLRANFFFNNLTVGTRRNWILDIFVKNTKKKCQSYKTLG